MGAKPTTYRLAPPIVPAADRLFGNGTYAVGPAARV
jgi:hypothetical protein